MLTRRQNKFALNVFRHRLATKEGRSETEMIELISMMVMVAMGRLDDYGLGDPN